MKPPDIVTWAESPMGFYVDRHYLGGRWVLEPAPITLAPYHQDILRHIFTPGPDGRYPYDVVGWAEPAKSGKSTLAGLMALYTALHIDKNSQVVMASNKQNQAASLMYRSLTDAVEMNPYLDSLTPARYEVSFRNGNQVAAIPSNSRGQAGSRFSLALFDEPWGYVHQDAVRLWGEHKADPTRQCSLKVAIGYGGYQDESILWQEILDEGLKGQPVPDLAHITNLDGQPACYANGRSFTFWSHQCRQPWQTDSWIEERRKELRPQEYARMLLVEFAEGQGDFVDDDHWQSLIDPNHCPLPPGSPNPLYVGLDLATKPGGDDAAVVAVYAEDGRVKVAWHKVWKGGRGRKQTLKLAQTVLPYLTRQSREYSIQAVYYDPYQAVMLSDALRDIGLRMVEVPQSHSGRGPRDTALFEMVANRTLVLYDHPDLKTAARGANVKEVADGMLFIQKQGRSRIDLLIALSHCAQPAYQIAHHRRAKVVTIGYDMQTGQVMAAGPTCGVGQAKGNVYVTYNGPNTEILERMAWPPGWAGWLNPDLAHRLKHSRPTYFIFEE